MIDLQLTQIEEDANTVTLAWTPPAGVEWYTLFAAHERVSNHAPVDRNGVVYKQARFAKTPEPQQIVATLQTSPGVFDVAVGTHTTVVVPPSGTLRWRPPGWNGGDPRQASSFPGYKTLSITAPGRYNLDDNSDYFITANVKATSPASGSRAAVNLVGGRNVVIVGCTIQIGAQTGSGDAADPTALLLDDGNPNGTIHIEGCDLTGNVNGITVRTPRKVQLQYNRIEVASYQGDHSSAHPDIIQIWDRTQGKLKMYVDRLTAVSDYTGYSVLIDNPVSWEMHNVNHKGPQGPAVYYGDGKSCLWTGDQLYFTGCKLDDALAGWGGDNARYEIHAGPGLPGGTYTSPENVTGGDCPPPLGTRQGDWIGYAREPKLTGISWIQGVPSGGDFVPANTVGSGYVPRGYA